jgi:hypothetical protein
VFHLKRFANTGRGFSNVSANKIDALVEFPISGLDLTDIILSKNATSPETVSASTAKGTEGTDQDKINDGMLLKHWCFCFFIQ